MPRHTWHVVVRPRRLTSHARHTRPIATRILPPQTCALLIRPTKIGHDDRLTSAARMVRITVRVPLHSLSATMLACSATRRRPLLRAPQGTVQLRRRATAAAPRCVRRRYNMRRRYGDERRGYLAARFPRPTAAAGRRFGLLPAHFAALLTRSRSPRFAFSPTAPNPSTIRHRLCRPPFCRRTTVHPPPTPMTATCH